MSGPVAVYSAAALLCTAIPCATLKPGLAGVYLPLIVVPLVLCSAAGALASHVRGPSLAELIAAVLWLLGGAARSFELWSLPPEESYAFGAALYRVYIAMVGMGGIGAALAGVLAVRLGGIIGTLQALGYAVLVADFGSRIMMWRQGGMGGAMFRVLTESQVLMVACAIVIGATAAWRGWGPGQRRLTMQ